MYLTLIFPARNMRYNIVSTYDTLITSLLINYLPYHYFCGPRLHDTTIMASLRLVAMGVS
jgi:hypothetical protein